VLAALGINTFFTGSAAGDIGVQDTLRIDAGKLAVSQGGVGRDTANGERLAVAMTTPLESRGGQTLVNIYEKWMGDTAQSSSLAKAIAEGYRSFHATLESEHLGLSGVNLDEEAVDMITFQRTYQAAAKVISTINELLELLVNL
jgi:flagellar hook-associated protein 1 FlgK